MQRTELYIIVHLMYVKFMFYISDNLYQNGNTATSQNFINGFPKSFGDCHV